MNSIDHLQIRSEQDAIELVQEKQRRMDFDYNWRGKIWGNTCTPSVARIFYDGKEYLGRNPYTSDPYNPLVEVVVISNDKP